MAQKSQLTDVLVRAGVLNKAQADALLQEQQKWGGRLASLVVEMGFLREDQLVHVLAKELRLPLAPLERMRAIPSEALGILAATTCERLLVLPLGIDNTYGRLQLAMPDPTEETVIGELRTSTGLELEPFVSTTTVIRRAIRINFYGESSAEVLRVIPEIRKEQDQHKVGSGGGQRNHPGKATKSSKYKSGSRPPLLPQGGQHASGRLTPIPTGSRAPRPASSGGHPVIHGGDEGAFRQGWAPGPTASHPASLELDAATEAVARKNDSHTSAHQIPSIIQQQTQQGVALNAAEQRLYTTEQKLSLVEQQLHTAEQRLRELQGELQNQRKQSTQQIHQLQTEIEELQALLRNRFQEHRVLMRALFDLLVARGYLNKDEIVRMLSSVAHSE